MFDSLWYDTLSKPFLNPPAWIFSPVWIVLYSTMLTALVLYSLKYSSKSKLRGYVYFITQLLLNLSWSPAFFIMHNLGLALGIILLMDLFVLLTIIRFHTVSKLSGIILVPYFLWILFATYLNIAFLILN